MTITLVEATKELIDAWGNCHSDDPISELWDELKSLQDAWKRETTPANIDLHDFTKSVAQLKETFIPGATGGGKTQSQLCECVACCNGEHAGNCKECAGWGDNTQERECSYCDGSGVCPKCNGRCSFCGDPNDGHIHDYVDGKYVRHGRG